MGMSVNETKKNNFVELLNGQLLILHKKQISELDNFESLPLAEQHVFIQNWGDITRTIQKRLTKRFEEIMLEQYTSQIGKIKMDSTKSNNSLKRKWKQFKKSVDDEAVSENHIHEVYQCGNDYPCTKCTKIFTSQEMQKFNIRLVPVKR